ncbi:Hydantoinase B/oxoprolinase-domain-containing protein [Aspergillus pseudodeflectus]|uniref:Hydantoinase B/oxoprolinase-domain-containing protein n=1 Tax=Aspergillus pseudodeflectus TaxID=176178 RepID=A0ABR4KMR6_9EURO
MGLAAEEVAGGFLRVANKSMSRPIRGLTEGRGIKAVQHTLATSSGAGGQHACDVSGALQIRDNVIHRYSSNLSAYVFGHRFMGIAEQMDKTLQNTSVLINIKERIDYSCGLFSPSGGLVANAPHIVAYQSKKWDNTLRPGDVIVSNHPAAGGSHLPDVTAIAHYRRS